MLKYTFDHSKLRGRIIEICKTQEALADIIGINKATLSQKLTGNVDFSRSEVMAVCDALRIDLSDVSNYFFQLQDVKNTSERRTDR